MKTSVLFLALLAAVPAQAAEIETKSTTPGVVWVSPAPVVYLASYAGMPQLDNSKVPWIKDARTASLTETSANALPAGLDGLLANLKEDLESTASGLAAFNEQYDREYLAQQSPVVDAQGQPVAADFSTLVSRDLSALSSRDLSANYGQNLSTSVAVPTSLPSVWWANRPQEIPVPTPGGIVVLPVFPPRTAWGNGPGVVATTPGGAVVSLMLVPQQPLQAESLGDLRRQFDIVQNDLDQIRAYLENHNLETKPVVTPPVTPASPTYQQPYLFPTGRERK
jgi:hypothetical protein